MTIKTFFEQHKLLLAPMAGVSDYVFRSLCLEQGADLGYTEMVSAKGLSFNNEKTKSLLQLAEGEEKIAVQLFGHEPQVIADEAAWIAGQLSERLAYIDINMGCPARKIVRKGDGCALMTDPALAQRIVDKTSSAARVPIGVKMRRGYYLGDESAVSFALKVEEAGASFVAVHGRYAEQYYRGEADWGTIARVKEALSIPVIGNGDISRGSDVANLKKLSSCDAFMIGRAARGNPWIFNSCRAVLAHKPDPGPPSLSVRMAGAKRHAALLSNGEGAGLVRMRKHAIWYVSGLPGASAARQRINDASSLDDFNAIFDDMLYYQEER